MRYLISFLLVLNFNVLSYGQTKLKGIISDEKYNNIPNASIYLNNSDKATYSNKNGYFELANISNQDTLTISKTGYKTKQVVITEVKETITIYLEKSKTSINEVKVFAKGNMAWRVMDKLQQNKEKNNPFNTPGLSVEVYNNITLRLNQFQKLNGVAPIIKKILKEYRTANPYADTNNIPVFISEAISELIMRTNPDMQKEIVKQTKVKTLGLAADGVINQLIGSSFQNVNFYSEIVRVLGKDFVSPIAGEWKRNFRWSYLGIVDLDNIPCYKLSFVPANDKDIAFSGVIWVDTASSALYKIKAEMDKRANMNYVNSFTLEQYFDLPDGFDKFYPVESILDIEVAVNRKDGLGMQAHLSTSALKVKRIEPPSIASFNAILDGNKNEIITEDSIWDEVRAYSDKSATQTTINQIKSIENSPTISFADKTLRFLGGGWAPTKSKFQVGTYFNFIAKNSIEGIRNSIGFRARDILDKRAAIQGYMAYGHDDKQWKFMTDVSYVVMRKPWLVANARVEHDIRRLGLNIFQLNDNSLSGQLLNASNHWGDLKKSYFTKSYLGSLFHEIKPGLTHKALYLNERFEPLFPFEYFENTPKSILPKTSNIINISEMNYEMRWAKGEVIIRNNTKRAVKLKKSRTNNIYLFRYTYGTAGDAYRYQYHKFFGEVTRVIRAYKYGNGFIDLYGFYTPSKLPYPMLYVQVGNQSPLFAKQAFNTMRFFEFTTDKFISLHYLHNFEGFLTNRIPLVRKLNLRSHANIKGLWGNINHENNELTPLMDKLGRPVLRNKSLDIKVPFVEGGIGVSNIFKVVRLDALYRFTYRDSRTLPVYLKASVLVGL
jgi:hypothetical protein